MRRGSRNSIIAQTLADAALINFAAWLAWFIRYELELGPATGEAFFYQSYRAYVPLAVVLTVLVIGIFRFEGFYAPLRGRSFSDELYTIVNATTTAILLIMAITFFLRPLVYSRAMYIYAVLLVVVLLSLARAATRLVRARLRKQGRGVDHVLIVGAGEVGRALLRNIVARPDLAY